MIPTKKLFLCTQEEAQLRGLDSWEKRVFYVLDGEAISEALQTASDLEGMSKDSDTVPLWDAISEKEREEFFQRLIQNFDPDKMVWPIFSEAIQNICRDLRPQWEANGR